MKVITDQNDNLYAYNEYAGDGRVARQFCGAMWSMSYSNRTNTFLDLSNGERLEHH